MPEEPNKWKKKLTPEQYRVTREKGTEAPYSGKYWNFFQDGTYHCINCGSELFLSNAKFNADCGWPSFFEPINNESIKTIPDFSLGMSRMEVVCRNCDAHLGHVFDDGPMPTGKRFCINSVAIKFKKRLTGDD